MRHPVLATFATFSFIGASLFAVACAKDGPEIEPIVGLPQPTDPADAGENKTIVAEKPKPKPKKDAAAAPVDAGPADTGAPPAGDDDDDDDDDGTVLQADCPAGDSSYLMKYMLASQMGGTTCTSGGDECAVDECCFVSPVPGMGESYCLAE